MIGAVRERRAGIDELALILEHALPGRVARDVPLSSLTTYRLGGPAALLVKTSAEDDLEALREALGAVREDIPVLVVGRGSNLLVAESGFPGLAVLIEGGLIEGGVVRGGLGELALGDGVVRAGGGVPLPVLARRAAAVGLGSLEFYVGIPGSVGGAVAMNAGGHGRDTAEVLLSARLVDLVPPATASPGSAVEVGVDALDLGYRRSCLRPTQVVVEASFRATPTPPQLCAARLAEVVAWRRAHQPRGSNAGSVFKNPPGDSAGRLVDACGLKGLAVGGAWVSERHANFFQAGPDATATDVARLVAEVTRRVEEATGVRLEAELRLVGFASDLEAP